jgi:probable HAF family extracellular repeat protein
MRCSEPGGSVAVAIVASRAPVAELGSLGDSVAALKLSIVVLSSILAPAALAASFRGIGDLPGGSFFSVATGVSSNGQVVVGYSSSALSGASYEAFRWTATNGIMALGDLPGGSFASIANAISGDGMVVVGDSSSSNNNEAFRWAQATGMVGLGDLPGGSVFSSANAVSADGAVVAGESSSTLSGTVRGEAFRWTPTNGMAGLGDLAGGNFDSHAYGISADGAVIVGYSSSSNGNEAFRWTSASGMAPLGDLAGGLFNSIAYGISADGSTIVGYGYPATTSHEAFRWTAGGGFAGLGFVPCDTWSIARAASGDGSIVVGDPQTAQGDCIFIWDAQHGIRRLRDVLANDYGLDLSGWTLRRAQAISADGMTIVGYGINPSGQTEGWIANLAPPLLVSSRQGNNIVLSWETNAVGFVLEQSASLGSSAAWSTNPASLYVSGRQFVVTNRIDEEHQFYRLSKP